MVNDSRAAYRKVAEACRQCAKDCSDDRVRARLLRIAEECMILARDAAGANIVTATSAMLADRIKQPRNVLRSRSL